ncbi:MAG TPA: LysM peptidoglycan-binding domain-containing protein [Pyrinomonadaceae bacterium]|nr:LysM peptidoglycan-binding domain-containing protein [Pyrinomonadaceae bacterium]
MAKVPQPQWKELRAKHVRPGRTKVAGVCLHDTAGSGTHNDTLYLANPGDGRPVSVDFTVERDGSIWKLNPDLAKFYCSHAGRRTKFKGYINGQCNRVLVGIEIVQKANLSLSPVYTDAQVRSVAELCAWLCERFKLESSDITTHRNIITDGSRSDPRQFPFEGKGGFWQYFWEARGKGDEHEASYVIKKTPDISKQQRTHTVAEGDSLFGIAKQYYGKGNLYPLIEQANSLRNGLILPGQVLVIPDEPAKGDAYKAPAPTKKPAEPKKPTYAKKASTKTPSVPKKPTELKKEEPKKEPEKSSYGSKPGPQTHKVAAKDTLYGIARKYYGDGKLFPLIEKANDLKDGAIHPGQVLVIPEKK